jgi:hypothetical protein
MAVKYLMGKKVIESNVIQWKEILIVSSLHYITSHHILPNITKGYQVLDGENQPEKDTKVCCS